MSNEYPIPDHLMPALNNIVYLNESADQSDDAWFEMVKGICKRFMAKHNIQGDPSEAGYQLMDYGNRQISD